MESTNPLIDLLGEALCVGTTLLIAWLKKKRDLRKLRKQGKLID